MPAQARQLLEVGLWGIPPKAQQRDKITPGDRVLVYVGAPDRVFIGDAVVQNGYHQWTTDEAEKYPMTSTFDHGLTLTQSRVWPKPVPLMSVWPQTQGSKTNPKALWYGAIASVSTADAELLLTAASGAGHAPVAPAHADQASTSSLTSPSSAPAAQGVSTTSAAAPAHAALPEASALFVVGERLKKFLLNPKPIQEDGTRAWFIDKILDALGYSDFDDVEHGSAQSSGTFPDMCCAQRASA